MTNRQAANPDDFEPDGDNPVQPTTSSVSGPPMRLAINAWFWDQPSTGSGQTVRHLVPALLEEDPSLEILLVAPDRVASGSKDLPTGASWHAVACRTGNLGKLRFEQVSFPRACRRLGADLAHVPYFASPLSPPVPTVVTIHDLIPMVLPAYRGKALVRFYTSLVGTAASRARLVLADSRASQQDILNHLKLPPEQVQVVYLAPAPDYQPVEDPAALDAVRRKYDLPPQFNLWLSGFDVRKNAGALLHAYTWIRDALGDDFPLVMAGRLPAEDSDFFPDPRRIAAELDLSQLVHFPGHIDEADKAALYSAARVFVYPSRYEGFGLPILEAMACGTPVVTSCASSLPELAGTAAYQIDPDDSRRLAAAIIALNVEDDWHQELRKQGLRQASLFSWQKTAAATLAAYRRVLAET